MQGICDNGRCINAQGGFKCECNQGYALDGEGKNCLGRRKKNKSLLFMARGLFLHPLQTTYRSKRIAIRCTEIQVDRYITSLFLSLFLSFFIYLFFHELYRFLLDIDECRISSELCGNGTCNNIAGSFRCDCFTGFENAAMMMEVCVGRSKFISYGWLRE